MHRGQHLHGIPDVFPGKCGEGFLLLQKISHMSVDFIRKVDHPRNQGLRMSEKTAQTHTALRAEKRLNTEEICG